MSAVPGSHCPAKVTQSHWQNAKSEGERKKNENARNKNKKTQTKIRTKQNQRVTAKG